MNKVLIVANWKCNPATLVEAKRIFNSVKRGIKNFRNIEVVICPPFVYLATLGAGYGGLAFGSQNCFWEEKGAFTGEISPLMLKDLGCKYVIIGHSERRGLMQETNQTVNKKLKAALKTELIPILCIGETKKEKEAGKVQQILTNQLKLSLDKVSGYKLQASRLCIAYEPIWAIGSGKPCDTITAMSMKLLIKKILTRLYNRRVVQEIRVLYGGSVNSKNTKEFIEEAKMDGLLIGGASLKPDEFIEIAKNIK